MNPNIEFEIMAEAFNHMTGFVAPGKDISPASPQEGKDRPREWNDWLLSYRSCVLATIRAIETVKPWPNLLYETKT